MNKMMNLGIVLAALSGVCNGLFTAPMKLETRWKWEHTWMAFILIACIAMPMGLVFSSVRNIDSVLAQSPRGSVTAALCFGFAWGFGAICFGKSVDTLGVSIANSLVIGLSSALGSLVPLLMAGSLGLDLRRTLLYGGIGAFLAGVVLCGFAGWLRDKRLATEISSQPSPTGYLFAVMAGVMSAVFNVGYTLSLPIANTGVRLGNSQFAATNCVWLLMLGAGAIPNLTYCYGLMVKHRTVNLLFKRPCLSSWCRSICMGLLWGASIFLYGAATPKLGDLGPSIGWPLSLAVGLLVANLMGLLLGEWRGTSRATVRWMQAGITVLLLAIGLCALSTGARL